MDSEGWPFGDSWSLRGNKEIASRYEVMERIGEGTFGEVFRARRRADGLVVALKEIHNEDSSRREVKALLLLDHPNVIKLHEYFVLGDNVVLVLEYLPIDLYRVLRAGKGKLTEGQLKGWTIQILRGLAACHSAAIIHRDLKPKNLLISADGVLKIADFGQARLAQPDNGRSLGSEVVENYANHVDSRDGRVSLHHEGNDGHKPSGASGIHSEATVETDVEELQSKTSDPNRKISARNSYTRAGDYSDVESPSEILGRAEKEPANSADKLQRDIGEGGVDDVAERTKAGQFVVADPVKDAKIENIESTWMESTEYMEEARVERRLGHKFPSNGPLRDLACTSAQERIETEASTSRSQQRDDGMQGGRRLSYEPEHFEGHVNTWSSASTGKSPVETAMLSQKGDTENMAHTSIVLPTKMGSSNLGWTLDGTSEEGLGTSRSENLASGIWAEGSEEYLQEGRSWEMDRCDSGLSDAVGTRWYDAPDFRFSYIDSKTSERMSRLEDHETSRTDHRDHETFRNDHHDHEAFRNHWENSCGIHVDHRSKLLESSHHNGSADETSDFTTMVGTRWYRAPELLYGASKYGVEVDMWAVGCVFGELLQGRTLFPGTSDLDQLSRIVRVFGSPCEATWSGVSLLPDFDKISFDEDRPPLTLGAQLPDVSDASLHFLEKMLTYDPKRRLTAGEALKDSLFHTNPLPCSNQELQLPTMDESESSEEEWGNWRDPDSPISDFEILS